MAIKAYYAHKGYVYVILLDNDQIKFVECPTDWFEQTRVDNKVTLKLTWPPPFQPKPAAQNYIDKATSAESLTVVKE